MIDKNKTRGRNRPFFPVDAAYYWEEGAVLTLESLGGASVVKPFQNLVNEIPLGISWEPKAQSLTEVQTEDITLNAYTGAAITLMHANLVSGSELVTNPAGTTVYSLTNDVVINTVNGTIAAKVGGALAAGGEVYVTYRWELTATQMAQGPQRFERVPDASMASGQITVLEGADPVFTDQYDTSVQYAVNDLLYANANSQLTNVAGTGGSAKVVGKVVAPPTLTYNLLGAELLLTIV